MPLDTFAAIVGVHPLHFNQVQVDGVSGCGRVWLQYDWQGPTAISRESVAMAIASAENLLEQFLGFPVSPTWYADYIVKLQKQNPIVLPKAHYITGGIKKTDIVTSDAVIVYSDTDTDGYAETATVTFVVPDEITDPTEVAAFYPGETTEAWRIRPVKVDLTAGTIVLNRHDLVLKSELEALRPTQIDGLDNSKFLTEVDIYRVWNDPSVQGILRACTLCNQQGCARCQFAEDTACIRGDDYRWGIVNLSAANWVDPSWVANLCYNKDPFAARVWFKAGWTGENIWDQAVAYLALSQLDVGLCECPTVQKRLEWWTTDVSKTDKNGTYKMGDWQKTNPWNYTRGAMYAYSLALKYKTAQGN